jgi:Cu/Ag efflux pump CusA
VVGSLFEQQKVFDVVVWGTPRVRNSLTGVRRLTIDTPEGGHVRLADVADVSIAPSPGIINRQGVSRYLDVGASVTGRDRDAVVRDVKNTLAGLTFPLEYHAEVLAADTQPTGLLIAVAAAAIIGIFLLLQVFLGSWRLATLSILVLPIAILGAIPAVLIAGGDLSFGSYIALFAVFGFAARACVLLFDHIRRLEQDEGEAFGPELVLRAARERFAPIALTALAATLVFVPALIMGSGPGLELVVPVATVAVGGLITSALVSLYVLPVLYLRFGFSRARAPEEEAAADLPAVLGELSRGAAGAGRVTGDIAGGVAMTEMRSTPDQRGD